MSLNNWVFLRMITSGRWRVRRFCSCRMAGLIVDHAESPGKHTLWNPSGCPSGPPGSYPSFQNTCRMSLSKSQDGSLLLTTQVKKLGSDFQPGKHLSTLLMCLDFPLFILIFHRTGLKHLHPCTPCLELHPFLLANSLNSIPFLKVQFTYSIFSKKPCPWFQPWFPPFTRFQTQVCLIPLDSHLIILQACTSVLIALYWGPPHLEFLWTRWRYN